MAMSTQGVVSRCCDAFLLKCHREEVATWRTQTQFSLLAKRVSLLKEKNCI